MDSIRESQWFPYFKIWVSPRETMRKIIEKPTNTHQVLTLLLLGNFVYAMDKAVIKSMADHISLTNLFTIIMLGTIIGAIIYYYGIGGLFYWLGKLLGGTGTYRDVRLSLAYAYIPSVFSLIIWIPSLLLFGRENFTSSTPNIDSSLGLSIAFLGFGIVDFIIGIWSIFVLLKCLGEAHNFSAWKALGTVIIPMVSLFTFILLLNIF